VSDTFRGFDAQPTLRGELLDVRPLRREDFDALYAAASDPLIWAQHPEPDRWREDVFRRYFDEQFESGGAVVAIDRRSGAIVGMSRFHGYDERRSEVEIGWTFLVRSHWGGTYNRELKRLMLAHAFRFVRSVVFLVGADNLRSQRAVEKIGAVRCGSRPDAYGRESFTYRINLSGAGAPDPRSR
jgi:RimJ/RimL family protein N-acetyltransferase